MALLSCVRDISVELPRPDEKIIIEAYIDLDSPAVVFLTKNFAYFDPVDLSALDHRIVWGDDATVVVSNGTINDTLQPASFEKYPHKGYIGSDIKGSIYGQYELNVYYDNKTYKATTTIPDSIGIDSLWFQMWMIDDSLNVFGPVGINWQDSPGLGNYYMITGRVEGKQKSFYRPIMTVNIIDDKLDDGRKILFYPIFRPYDGNAFYGQDRDTSISSVNYYLFKVGDTVSIKLSTMDIYSFRFWNSFFRNYASAGNPFANPASVISNIQGENVGGYWAGYGSYIQTVYIQDSTTVIKID